MTRSQLQVHINTLNDIAGVLDAQEDLDNGLLETMRLAIVELAEAVICLSGLTPEEF